MITKVTFTPAMASASAVTLHDPATMNTRYLSKVEGLFGPPAPRDVTRVRPGVDGIVDQTAYLGERSITLEGELWSATGGASMNDLSTISEAFYSSLLSPGRLEWTLENGDVRWCNVKLAGGIETSIEGGASRSIQYQVQLRASDPRVYEGPYLTAEQTVSSTRSGSGLTWAYTSSSHSYTGTAPSPVTIVVSAPSGNSLTVQEIAVTVPTAYGSLVKQAYTSGLFTNPSMSLVGNNTAGTGSGDPTVAAAGSVTFYSATRTATSLNGISAVSEFPYLYPGSVTFGLKSSSANVDGASVAFKYYRAYW